MIHCWTRGVYTHEGSYGCHVLLFSHEPTGAMARSSQISGRSRSFDCGMMRCCSFRTVSMDTVPQPVPCPCIEMHLAFMSCDRYVQLRGCYDKIAVVTLSLPPIYPKARPSKGSARPAHYGCGPRIGDPAPNHGLKRSLSSGNLATSANTLVRSRSSFVPADKDG